MTYRIVITGGGTGGHIMPALAVAEELRQAGHTVMFIGSSHGPERELVEAQGLEFYGIEAGKLRRYFDWQNFVDSFRVVVGVLQAGLILSRLKPDAIFAKGGYVSVPVAYAASWLGIPVVAHESDAVMGLANRLVSRSAEVVCTGFPVSTYPATLRAKLRFTGNPVRQLVTQKLSTKAELYKKYSLDPKRPTLLFMGSSQGAHPINELVVSALTDLLADWQVIHLAGPADAAWVVEVKAKLPAESKSYYLPYGFVGEDLPELLVLADLVFSRASANSVAELAALGKATVLIPLPSAASDHQRANAKVIAKQEGSIVVEQSELSSNKLVKLIKKLLADEDQLKALRRNIKAFYSPQAPKLIAEAVVEVASKPVL